MHRDCVTIIPCCQRDNHGEFAANANFWGPATQVKFGIGEIGLDVKSQL